MEMASDNSITISAIVVSYNTREMSLECLRALSADLQGIDSEILVVDNDSGDGTPAAVAQEFPTVRVIANSDNRGFGAANNQGMLAARGEYFLLINSDTFPKKGAVAAMLQCIRENPKAAVVGPKLLYGNGSAQRSCYRFPTPFMAWMENLWIASLVPVSSPFSDLRHWNHDTLRSVDFAIGACLLVRRRAVEQVGGFDEEFFMYSEEADWQKRMRQAGWLTLFTPAAVVTHLAGASGATQKSRVNGHFFQSLDYYQCKHHGVTGLGLFRLAMILGCSLRAAGWLVACVIPGRRKTAWQKVKFRLWLVLRQATDWQIVGRLPVSARIPRLLPRPASARAQPSPLG